MWDESVISPSVEMESRVRKKCVEAGEQNWLKAGVSQCSVSAVQQPLTHSYTAFKCWRLKGFFVVSHFKKKHFKQCRAQRGKRNTFWNVTTQMNSDMKDIEKSKLALLTNFLCVLKFLIRKVSKRPERHTQQQTFNNLSLFKKAFPDSMQQKSEGDLTELKNRNLPTLLDLTHVAQSLQPQPYTSSDWAYTTQPGLDVRKCKGTGGDVVTGVLSSSPAAAVRAQSFTTSSIYTQRQHRKKRGRLVPGTWNFTNSLQVQWVSVSRVARKAYTMTALI